MLIFGRWLTCARSSAGRHPRAIQAAAPHVRLNHRDQPIEDSTLRTVHPAEHLRRAYLVSALDQPSRQATRATTGRTLQQHGIGGPALTRLPQRLPERVALRLATHQSDPAEPKEPQACPDRPLLSRHCA